jgi:hypothetical protein
MTNCKRCGFKKWLKPDGEKFERVNGHWVRRMKCASCGSHQLEAEPAIYQKPKILYFDIETALMDVAIFDLFVKSQYINRQAIIKSSFVICWSACWVSDDSEFQYVMSDRVREDEARANSDRRCLTWLWNLMDSADYVVGHNSDRFDVKKVHYRFTRNGMGLPYVFKQIDTLKMARKYYASESNQLEHWSLVKGGKPKQDTEYNDWYKIRTNPDAGTLQKMENYCRGDVREGVNVYLDFKKEIEASGRKVIK